MMRSPKHITLAVLTAQRIIEPAHPWLTYEGIIIRCTVTEGRLGHVLADLIRSGDVEAREGRDEFDGTDPEMEYTATPLGIRRALGAL